eukprot:CAMPEP_0170070818 /NCGR_PEP_ID=MMETSP0019_2-20121128/8964_1 /TAXON_ID=98059 /ORGANISM="Dinobryon sp., Strain UTEXLB2267" /LENGTH=405 /DNA_ID=CAMNT_0010279185 /DNA_START=204 /DNA_END=1421 /DNA_ORIENTATION=+
MKVEQVIRNLITNALKFTPEGGKVQLRFSMRRSEQQHQPVLDEKEGINFREVGVWRCEVVDNGAGISTNDQRKVFGEFVQFRKNELQAGGGSGLGLWISRRIISMHQGLLGFHSDGEGMGSTFFLELPIFTTVVSLKADRETAMRTALLNIRSSFSTDNSPSLMTLRSYNNLSSVYCDHNRAIDNEEINNSTVIRNMDNTKYNELNDSVETGIANVTEEHEDLNDILETHRPFRLTASSQSTASVVEFANRKVSLVLPLQHDIVAIQEKRRIVRILIVDDSALNRKIIIRLIDKEKARNKELANVHIVEADDGLVAIEKLRTEIFSFDIIFMDFIMLKMNGPEAAKFMRKELNYNGIIIGVTGNVQPNEMTTFLNSGTNEVLTKPLSQKIFSSTLFKYLNREAVG